MPLTARSGAFSARSGCSSARSNRSGGGGARYDEMDLYFKEFGLADGSSLPGQSLASLSSEADEEERRQKAGAERQDREAKRSQVAAKLDEWAANFRKAHGRDPTDADRKRSAPQRELAKLKTDLDKYIGALDGTGGGGAGSAPDSDEDGIAAAKRAEADALKAVEMDEQNFAAWKATAIVKGKMQKCVGTNEKARACL